MSARLVRTGLLAALAAAVVTTVVAALVHGLGVSFEVPDGGETIPLSGIAFVTGVFSLVGVVTAVALLRWSTRPAELFVRATVGLTALSLVPPWLVGSSVSTALALVVLHLVAAAVVIPSLARSLHGLDLSARERGSRPSRTDGAACANPD